VRPIPSATIARISARAIEGLRKDALVNIEEIAKALRISLSGLFQDV